MKKLWILLIPVILVIISGCAGTWGDISEAQSKGEKNNVIHHLKEIDKSDPTYAFAIGLLCYNYYENEQYHEAIDACKEALNFKINQNTGWTVLSQAQYKLGQIDLAISSQKNIVALMPDNSDAFATLANLYIQNKQYDEAITAAKRAIELKSDNAVAYNNLGAAYGMKKQYIEAIKALKKVNEIYPKYANAYSWMGSFLMEQNAYTEAVGAYKKGIEAEPSEPTLHTSLAVAYYRMGRYDDAIAAINKAIELQTLTGIGVNISIEGGHPVVKGVINNGPAKKADIQVGDKIVEIDGKSTAGWKVENVVQGLKGIVDTQVVLTIERSDNKIKKTVAREKIVPEGAALSIVIRSLVYRQKGDLDKAFSDAERAATLNSSDAPIQLSLGAAYLDRGQYDESIKLLSPIKDNSTARLLEATAYAKQGKMKEAENVYLSIPEEEIDPNNIPQAHDRMALLQTFKPIVKEHRDNARSLESKGQYKEALSEFSAALKIADDTETQEIQETTFSMLRKNPLLADLPEDARKYALRSEVLVKEGNFEQAATEIKKAIQIAPYAGRLHYNSALINAELKKYPEAIRNMKIYVKASHDAPDARAAQDEIIKWELMMEKGQ